VFPPSWLLLPCANCQHRNAQLSDAFLVINQIESYNAQDTEAVARLASAIERFTGVCVLVLEANIGSFVLLQIAEWRL
jgi:hypothetical protein